MNIAQKYTIKRRIEQQN